MCSNESLAIIVPHAHRQYSGNIAEQAFKAVCNMNPAIIVVLGARHNGKGDLHFGWTEKITESRNEHSLLNIKNYIDEYFPDQIKIPILVGPMSDNRFKSHARLLDSICEHYDTLFIISTDMSHINGRFNDAMPIRDTLKYIKNRESPVVQCISYPTSESFDRLNDLDNNNNLSMCGINAVKLFLCIRSMWLTYGIVDGYGNSIHFNANSFYDELVHKSTQDGCVSHL